jgi:hypothetical protein
LDKGHHKAWGVLPGISLFGRAKPQTHRLFAQRNQSSSTSGLFLNLRMCIGNNC